MKLHRYVGWRRILRPPFRVFSSYVHLSYGLRGQSRACRGESREARTWGSAGSRQPVRSHEVAMYMQANIVIIIVKNWNGHRHHDNGNGYNNDNNNNKILVNNIDKGQSHHLNWSSVRRRERVKRVRSGRSSSLVVVLLLNVVIVLFLHDLRINNDRGIDNDI